MTIDSTGWTRLDYVRFYMEQWHAPVIPVGKNKVPKVSWTEYQHRMPTTQELSLWFTKRHPYGLVLVCGNVSNNLWAVDIDSQAVFTALEEAGAFKEGVSIMKSAKPGGYHLLLRSIEVPFSIHQGILPGIFKDMGIQGDHCLTIVPDTPDRFWLPGHLWDELLEVDQAAWLQEFAGYTREGATGEPSREGWLPPILCPYHDDTHPSLSINLADRGFVCHGCGAKGKLSQLVADCEAKGYKLPDVVYAHTEALQSVPVASSPDKKGLRAYEHGIGEPITPEDLPPEIVEGVFYEQDMGVVYGQAGVGKSTLFTSGAADFALGGRLWGRWKVTKPCNVYYLDLENPPGETRLAIQSAIGDIREAWGRIKVGEMTGHGFDIFNKFWQDELRTAVRKHKADVLIFDNLSKATPMGSEHIMRDKEMRDFLGIMRPIAADFTMLIILIHHAGWTVFDRMGNPMPLHEKGSTSLRDDANFVFEMSRIKASGEHLSKIVIKKIRSRRAGIVAGDEFICKYDPLTMRLGPATKPETIKMLEFLCKQFTHGQIAKVLGRDRTAVPHYLAGRNEIRGEVKEKLIELAASHGYQHEV